MFQPRPSLVRCLPDNAATNVRHLQRRADLIGVEVVELFILFAFLLIDSGQGRIAAGLVDIKTALPRRFFAQHSQTLPEEVFVFGLAVYLRRLADAPSKAVVAVGADALKLAVNQRFSFDQAVFAVVAERLEFAQPYSLFNQVSPRIVGIFLIAPALDAVVFDLIELAGVEVQAVRGWVVAELFAIHQAPGVAAMQLTIRFVFVSDLTTQFVEGADQFARESD